MNIKSEVKKGENSTLDIIGEIEATDFESYREAATKKAGEHIEIKGFRKGNAPVDMIEKKVGPMAILDEMAHMAVSAAFPKLLEEHNIKAIGQPAVNITKLATGNPLGFTITVSVLPEIKLADYKKIAAKEMGKEEDVEVNDKELDDAIFQIKRMRAQTAKAEKGEDVTKIEDKDLPELTDDYVKTLGNFDNVADFREKLRVNLGEEKKMKEAEKKQIAIIEKIIEKSDFETPQMLINFELEKMMHQFEHDIAMSGISFDEYLKKIEKTKEDLQKEWSEPAKKRAQMQLVVSEIAQTEKLHPTDEDITKEAAQLIEQYKNVKGVNEQSIKAYVASMLTNKNVFDFLSNQK